MKDYHTHHHPARARAEEEGMSVNYTAKLFGGPKDEGLRGRIGENYQRKDVCLHIVSSGMDGKVGAYLLGVEVGTVGDERDDRGHPQLVWSSQNDMCAAMNLVSEAVAGIDGLGPVSVVLGMDVG